MGRSVGFFLPGLHFSVPRCLCGSSKEQSREYTYDEEGNLTAKEKLGDLWLYGYDQRNRLIWAEHKVDAISAVDLRVEYAYDPVVSQFEM